MAVDNVSMRTTRLPRCFWSRRAVPPAPPSKRPEHAQLQRKERTKTESSAHAGPTDLEIVALSQVLPGISVSPPDYRPVRSEVSRPPGCDPYRV